jgi:hypothetical protein
MPSVKLNAKRLGRKTDNNVEPFTGLMQIG